MIFFTTELHGVTQSFSSILLVVMYPVVNKEIKLTEYLNTRNPHANLLRYVSVFWKSCLAMLPVGLSSFSSM